MDKVLGSATYRESVSTLMTAIMGVEFAYAATDVSMDAFARNGVTPTASPGMAEQKGQGWGLNSNN